MPEQSSLGDISGGSEDENEKDQCSTELQRKRVGEVIELVKGKKPDEVLEEKKEGAVHYLTVETMTDGSIKYTTDTDIPKAKKQDSVMIMDGSKSGRCYYGNEGVVGSTMAVLRPEGVNPFYLNQFLTENFNRLNSATRGSAVPHTDKELLRGLEIIDFPIDEQRRIASVLYNVDQAISKTEEIIEQTQRVKKGLMQDLFTEGYYSHEEFEETRLGPLTQKMPTSWDNPSMSKIMSSQELGTNERGALDDPDGNITLIKMGNLGFGNWNFSELEDVERTDEVMENTLEKGDMLFNTRNTPALVGKTAVWEFDREAVHDNNLMKINFGDRVATPHYVNYYLASDYGRTQLRGRVHGTTSVAAIYNKDLDDIKIPLPEKEEQEKIANSLHSLDKKIEENRKYKEQLQRLKKGLMQDLLTGSVRTNEDVEVLDEVVEVENNG